MSLLWNSAEARDYVGSHRRTSIKDRHQYGPGAPLSRLILDTGPPSLYEGGRVFAQEDNIVVLIRELIRAHMRRRGTPGERMRVLPSRGPALGWNCRGQTRRRARAFPPRVLARPCFRGSTTLVSATLCLLEREKHRNTRFHLINP